MPQIRRRRVVTSPRRDPLNAQAYKTQRVELPEDLWQPLYDRVNIATTIPSSVSFYSTPKGQSATLISGTVAAAKVKTYRDTNMDSSSVVPSKMFKFVGVSLAIVHATRQLITNGADRDLIMDGGALQIRIIDKDLLFLPLLNFPLLNPTAAASTTLNASTMFVNAYGGGAGVPMYKLPINITLNPYENFLCAVAFDTVASLVLTTTADLCLYLQGFQRRPS